MPNRTKFTMTTTDGRKKLISKIHAIAILSGHPRCSKDRSIRVRTMAKEVLLFLDKHEPHSDCK